jgi:hypothetical protein
LRAGAGWYGFTERSARACCLRCWRRWNDADVSSGDPSVPSLTLLRHGSGRRTLSEKLDHSDRLRDRSGNRLLWGSVRDLPASYRT